MIIEGDCLEEMRKMGDNSISCIVTDPPYGLHFMGKDWDSFKFKSTVGKGTNWNLQAGEKRKVNCSDSDGSYLAGTYDDSRNDEFQQFIYKWAIEALRIIKPGGHVLMFGAPRRYHRQVCGLEDAGWEIRDCLMWIFGSGFPKSHNHFGIDGYGTALKPAYEPIIMAMKPCDGTFKQNAEKWGQAGINIHECRIEQDEIETKKNSGHRFGFKKDFLGCENNYHIGRWPANIIFDEETAKMLDEQSKIDASRFFYCAKTSSRERNEGLQELPDKKTIYMATSNGTGNPNITIDDQGRERDRFSSLKKNNHPTVKPLKLMEYLIKLVMPPKDGILLDPFAGSGTTILAANRLGFNAIGIEKCKEYCKIARARLDHYNSENLKVI